nr:MAG TPA: hypothetical protein [Caudoviricetes sp.]
MPFKGFLVVFLTSNKVWRLNPLKKQIWLYISSKAK